MRARILNTTAVTALLLGGLAFAPEQAAYASDCRPSNHCYGQAEWNVYRINGIHAKLTVSCLTVPSTGDNFATEEMWLATNNSGGSDWVETGMAYGNPQGNKRYFFWADNKGSSYHEHDLSIAAALHTTYRDQISYTGDSTWGVYRNGTLLGTSTGNPWPSDWAAAGEETTHGGAEAAAVQSELEYQDNAGGWHPGWKTPTYTPNLRSDSPPYAAWDPAYTGVESYSNCAFGASAAQEAAQQAAQQAPVNRLSAGVDAGLKGIATDLAAANGESAPTGITYTATSRKAAVNATGGDTVDTDGQSYLLQLHGNFNGAMAKIPSTAKAPAGNVMTAVVDAATGQISDWSIGKDTVDLNALGRTVQLG